MTDVTIWATPSNAATGDALTSTTRANDVEIRITHAEHEAEQDHKWDTASPHAPGGWVPAVDQITGRSVKIRAISCGASCKCAAEVALAEATS